MKLQVAWNFKISRTELQVTSQGRERIDLPAAEWLRDVQSPLLIPVAFDYGQVKAKKITLHYDIMGLTTLRKRRKELWSEDAYYAILSGLEQSVMACLERSSRPLERMLFDIEHIYLTPEGMPRFVYVPLDGVVYDAGANTPLVMLAALADPKKMKFDNMRGPEHAARLRIYVAQEKIFSLNGYKRFLDEEFPERRQYQQVSALGVAAPQGDPSSMGSSALFLDSLFTTPAPQAAPTQAAWPGQTGQTMVPQAPNGAAWQVAPQPTQQRVGAFPQPVQQQAQQRVAAAPQATQAQRGAYQQQAPVQQAPTQQLSVARFVLRRIATGEEFPLEEGARTVVGSAPDADVRVGNNPSFGQRQFSVTVSDGAVTLMDLGSMSGTVARNTRLVSHDVAALYLGEPFQSAGEEFCVLIRRDAAQQGWSNTLSMGR